MSGRPSDRVDHRRPKSAWATIKRRQSLAEDRISVEDKFRCSDGSSVASREEQRGDIEKEIEAFNRMKMELFGRAAHSRLPTDQGSKHSKHLSRNPQRLRREGSLKYDIPGFSDGKQLERFENVIPGADYDSLDEEIEAFNRSKIRNEGKRSLDAKDVECDSQEVAWDSLDEEIEAFNKARTLDSGDASQIVAPAKEEKFERRRTSTTKTISSTNENCSDPRDQDEAVLFEEITSLVPEDGNHGLKRPKAIHVVAKRSYSDKGPSGKTIDKPNSNAKYPASYNAGDLLALDFETARRNVMERYNFHGHIDEAECGGGFKTDDPSTKANELFGFGRRSTRNVGKQNSLNITNKEAYKPKVKLKPIKNRPSKPMGTDENSRRSHETVNNRRSIPKLLEALPNRLISDQGKYSTSDLLTKSNTHQRQTNYCSSSRHNETKPHVSLQSINAFSLQEYDVDNTKANNENTLARHLKRDSHDYDLSFGSFERNGDPFASHRDVFRGSVHDHRLSDPLSVTSMWQPSDNFLSGEQPLNNFPERRKDEIESKLTSNLYSSSDDWKNQSLADVWQQTKRDLGSF